MNEATRSMAAALFAKPLDECGYPELKQLAAQYPYFAPVQLLFALKQKEINETLYQQEVQKTALYFHNPLWLDYLLNSKEYKEEITGEETGDTILVSTATPETKQPEPEEKETETVSPVPAPIIPVTTEIKPVDSTPPALNVVDLAEEASEATEEINTPLSAAGAVKEPWEAVAEPEPAVEKITETETTRIETAIANAVITGVSAKPETGTSLLPDTETPAFVSGPETTVSTEPEESPLTETMKLPVHFPSDLDTLKKDEPVSETTLSFEPFHTVDYFASQGIKLREELLDKDKFGKQLKSFTEWLKTMKKLPKTDVEKAISTGADSQVNQLAATSVAGGDEVVTEAMAEVWTHQGNREKAIAIYEKLSLQNPAKSLYFASLIQQLKNN